MYKQKIRESHTIQILWICQLNGILKKNLQYFVFYSCIRFSEKKLRITDYQYILNYDHSVFIQIISQMYFSIPRAI